MISCQFQSQKYRRNLHHNIITQIMSWWLRHLTAKKFGLLFQKWRILLIKKEVDYVWSLKLVLIQHSPWLLLVKIKCQLQNTWKIELWNKSEGWPPLTSHLSHTRERYSKFCLEDRILSIILLTAECIEHFVSKSSVIRGS